MTKPVGAPNLRPPKLTAEDEALIAATLAEVGPPPSPTPPADLPDLAEQLSPATIRRRLAAGQCARCGVGVQTTKNRRRSPLCPACWQTHGWCSACQRAKPRAQFFAQRTSGRHGLSTECRACRNGRNVAADPHPCARCRRPILPGPHARPKLCERCRAGHAWCTLCGPRPRRAFYRAIREGRLHSGRCVNCDHVTGRPQAREQRAEILAAVAERERVVLAMVAAARAEGRRVLWADVAAAIGRSVHAARGIYNRARQKARGSE